MRNRCTASPNAVIIGASSESIHAIQTALRMGISVIALDGNPDAEGLRHASKSFVVDIRNHKALTSVLDQFSPDVIIPIPIGRYLTSIGAVNDHYNLCGITHEAATLCTDKHRFHNALFPGNLRQADHVLIQSGSTDIPVGIDAFNYPVVAKPRYGSGSRSVRIYSNANEFMNRFFAGLPYDEDYVLETFVQGTEYGVDAAMINGTFHLVLLREKLMTPPPYCQCVGYFSVVRTDENALFINAVENTLHEAGRLLGLDNCLLHADIVHTKSGVFPIEISARPSGHNLHNIFTPMATGVDMISEYLKFTLPQLNMPFSFVPSHTENMLIKYFDLHEGCVLRIPDREYLCKHYPLRVYECNILPGMQLHKVTDGHSLMERGFYIITGENRGELMSISNEIDELFVVE